MAGSQSYPVDVLGQQDHVGPDLGGAKHGGGIRGEEGAAHAAAEDHHPALFQVPDGTGPDVGLRHLFDLQRRLDPDVHALLLQHVGHGHAVHGGGQHAHVVGTGALDVALAVFHAAPEVAAADDDAHLHTQLRARLDDVAHLTDHVKIQSRLLVTGKRLTADLEQDTPKLRFCSHKTSPHFFIFVVLL